MYIYIYKNKTYKIYKIFYEILLFSEPLKHSLRLFEYRLLWYKDTASMFLAYRLYCCKHI